MLPGGIQLKVGDLVIRKVSPHAGDHLNSLQEASAYQQRWRLGPGLILSKQMAGTPRHPCITVYYPKTGDTYDIAESLMEVVSESR